MHAAFDLYYLQQKIVYSVWFTHLKYAGKGAQHDANYADANLQLNSTSVGLKSKRSLSKETSVALHVMR